jgi:hypothetical protein
MIFCGIDVHSDNRFASFQMMPTRFCIPGVCQTIWRKFVRLAPYQAELFGARVRSIIFIRRRSRCELTWMTVIPYVEPGVAPIFAPTAPL